MHKKIYYVFRCFFLFALLASASQFSQAENSDLIIVIENLHGKLLYNMQNAEELGYQGRLDRISPVIEESFDFPLIAKVILSRYWKQINDEQKTRFIDTLKELTISTYAARFDGYNDDRFETGTIEDLKKGRKLVKTKIVSNTNSEDKLEYLVHKRDGRWYIISVIANGVNDLSLKRAEYSAVIKDQGFDQLIDKIANKISELEKT